MSNERLKQAILDMVRELDYVSFVNLSKIEGFKGDRTWAIPGNIVFWSGMSEEAIRAMQELVMDDLIHGVTANPLVYVIDGMYLDFPLATSIHRQYKKPHWYRVTFRPGPEVKEVRAR